MACTLYGLRSGVTNKSYQQFVCIFSFHLSDNNSVAQAAARVAQSTRLCI